MDKKGEEHKEKQEVEEAAKPEQEDEHEVDFSKFNR